MMTRIEWQRSDRPVSLAPILETDEPTLHDHIVVNFLARQMHHLGRRFWVLLPDREDTTPEEFTTACRYYSGEPGNPHVSPGASWCAWLVMELRALREAEPAPGQTSAAPMPERYQRLLPKPGPVLVPIAHMLPGHRLTWGGISAYPDGEDR